MTRIKRLYGALERIQQDAAAWQVDEEADWTRRYEADPATVRAELRALHRCRSADRESVEDLYWRDLLESTGDEQEIVAASLDRLKLVPGWGPLLDLGESGRRRLTDHCLGALDPASSKPVVDRLTADAGHRESRGEPGGAAVCYALAHDHALRDGSGVEPARRALLRFLAVRALERHRGSRDADRCFRFVVDLMRRVPSLDLRGGSAGRDELLFSVQEWLGERWEQRGDWTRAEEAFAGAAAAGAGEGREAAAIRWAAASVHLDKPRAALERLSLVLEDPGRPPSRTLYRRLRRRLGGELDRRSVFELWLDLGEDLDRLGFDGDVPDREAMEESRRGVESAIRNRDAEAGERARQLLLLAFLFFTQGDFVAAERCLADPRLHTLDGDPLLEVLSGALGACCRLAAGAAGEARVRLERLWPQARRRLDPDRLVPFLGYRMAATAADATAEVADVVRLADHFAHAFERLLRHQPGAGARRSARRNHQRAIELAVEALRTAACRAGTETAAGQQCLARLWSLLEVCRNPELHWQPASPLEESVAERIDELEERFHHALRDELLGRRPPVGSGWREPLHDLLLFEMTHREDARFATLEGAVPDDWGVSLLFFLLAESSEGEDLLSVVHRDGRFLAAKIPLEPSRLGDRLRAYRYRHRSVATPGSRDVAGPGHRDVEANAKALDPPALVEILPPEAARWLSEDRQLATGATSSSAAPWTVVPDGLLHALPLEVLPQTPGAREARLGRPIRYRLRVTDRPTVREPLAWAGRWWLGVAIEAYEPPFRRLSWACQEVMAASHRLPGTARAELLLDRQAHAGNLERRVAELRPLVLHFGVHGAYDETHPEACALILFDQAGSAGEPFASRRIRRLPLEGVELVVLSACASLRGRSDRGAGMEGVAWAFLEGGAGQVVASRYPVGDRESKTFMEHFYRHLHEMPPVAALEAARGECLAGGMTDHEVGAWALWT